MYAYIFPGGDRPLSMPALPRPGDLVIAADSGYEHAVACGLDVDILIGDMDSISPTALAAAQRSATEVVTCHRDKDQTDLELAMLEAKHRGASRIVVVGGAGGRIDHYLANLLLLGSAEFAGIGVVAWIGTSHVTVVRAQARIRVRLNEVISLIPIGGAATGVTTAGLKYPLNNETLYPGSPRGVSNVCENTEVAITLDGGTLLVIRPEASGDLESTS